MRRALLAAVTVASIAVAGAPASAQSGPQSSPEESDRRAPVVNEDDPGAVPGEYIVVLTDRAQARHERAAERSAKNDGGHVRRRYVAALNGFEARLNAKALDRLRSNPNVAFVEAVTTVQVTTTQTGATWGLDRVDQRDRPLDGTYTYTPDGTGVHAYVIDTGLRSGHTEFAGRVGNGTDIVDGDSTPDDCHGHGTHVAGTVGGTTYGVAKKVTLHAVRVLDCQGSGTNAQVIGGIDWVAANHVSPAVANMSLGGSASTAIDNAVQNAIAAGVTFVVAAGNESTNACTKSPARAANAITVASTTSTDARSSFSNYGTCVDVFAPGSSITSAWHTSNSATNTISGTSMASPHVAGVAALWLDDNPSATPAQVTSQITGTATTGVVSSAGSGSPNRLVYSPLSGTTPPPPPPAGCQLAETHAGTLAGTGDSEQHPNGTYYWSGSGTHRGCLEGPGSADFDLKLYKWSSSWGWQVVASSVGATSSESITYSGSSGYYTWLVESYSGSGAYTFGLTRP